MRRKTISPLTNHFLLVEVIQVEDPLPLPYDVIKPSIEPHSPHSPRDTWDSASKIDTLSYESHSISDTYVNSSSGTDDLEDSPLDHALSFIDLNQIVDLETHDLSKNQSSTIDHSSSSGDYFDPEV